MSIELADIASATSTYIHDHVDVRVKRITGNLEPGEAGTLTVRWTNADAPVGVRLTGVFLHLSVSPDSPPVAQMKAPGSAILQPRAVPDLDAPRLAPNALVDEMYVFLPDPTGGVEYEFDSTLDVGETAELGLEFEATRAGTATFSAHIHASVALEDLFPSDRGTSATGDTVIKATRSVSV